MKSLLRQARRQVVTVDASTTVMEAIEAMSNATVGAVLVIEHDELQGVFTERDVMLRVVLQKRDPATTPVRDVMTSPVTTITEDVATIDDVLRMMSERRIRHVPVLDGDGQVKAVISMRHVLQRKVEDLAREVDSLEAYVGADGIGG